MATMRVDDSILGDLAKPQMKGHRGALEVILESPIGFDQDILHNVADIYSLLNTAIQSNSDQMPNDLSVVIEQSVNRGVIPCASLLKQLTRLLDIGPHRIALPLSAFEFFATLLLLLTTFRRRSTRDQGGVAGTISAIRRKHSFATLANAS